jgi:hypothetical protein
LPKHPFSVAAAFEASFRNGAFVLLAVLPWAVGRRRVSWLWLRLAPEINALRTDDSALEIGALQISTNDPAAMAEPDRQAKADEGTKQGAPNLPCMTCHFGLFGKNQLNRNS